MDYGTRRPSDQPWWLSFRDIDKHKCNWRSDRVYQVKTTNLQVEQSFERLGARAVEDGGDMS